MTHKRLKQKQRSSSTVPLLHNTFWVSALASIQVCMQYTCTSYRTMTNRQQWHSRRRNAKNATHSKASARQGQKSHIATPREATYGGSNHLGEIPMPLLRGQHRKHNQEWHGQRRRPLWQTISRPQRTSLSRTDARVPQVRRKGTVSTRPWPNQMQPQETQWKSLLNHALVC